MSDATAPARTSSRLPLFGHAAVPATLVPM